MKKSVIPIVVAVIILAGGWYLYQQNQAKAPSEEQTMTPTPAPTPSTEPTGQTSTSTKPTGADYTPPGNDGEPPAPDVQVVQVTYDGSKFTPSTVTIKAGDYVFFKNTGTSPFWPASDPHPTHTTYGGFDADQPIAAGATYKFQFNKVGTWGYHDHLSARHTGTVIVTAK